MQAGRVFLITMTFGTMALSALACTADGPTMGRDTISRTTFVEVYYELRKKGLRSPGMEITIEGRDSVLAEHGVTEEDLLAFVDAWGSDFELMRGIWEEVDSLQREDRMEGRGGETGREGDGPGEGRQGLRGSGG